MWIVKICPSNIHSLYNVAWDTLSCRSLSWSFWCLRHTLDYCMIGWDVAWLPYSLWKHDPTDFLLFSQGKPFVHEENEASSLAQSQQEKRVFKCLSCGYLFGNLSDLKRHLKVRHMVQMQAIAGMDQMQISEVEVNPDKCLWTNWYFNTDFKNDLNILCRIDL